MTPRPIAQNDELNLGNYSEILFQHLKQTPNLDLRESSAPFYMELPSLIKTRMIWNSRPESLNFNLFDKYFFEFSTNVDLKSGKPWMISSFLKKNEEFEFQLPWAAVKISTMPLPLPESKLENFLTQAWLDYALSPELWSPSGKWLRFHQRLMQIFNQKNLLIESPDIGFYRLNSKAKLIEKYGFKGDDLGDFYQIILPWDFSLTSLTGLEAIINQEL